MAAIAFPASSSPGFRPGEGSGVLKNCYADKDGNTVGWFRSAGLTPFADATVGTPRGMLSTDGALYVAVLDKLVSIDSGGAVTVLGGTLAGSLPVTMARNNKVPDPDLAIVTENGAFTVSAGSVIAWPDIDVGAPNSVSMLDSYFLFTYGNGAIIASDLNSTAINTLSTARAEANPDGLLRGTVAGRQFFAWGPASLEVFDNAGTSPFPLARSAVIPVGLFGPWAVAGFEEGWDLQQIFVASDGTVRRLNGYQPDRISNRAVERDIQGVTVASTLYAHVYGVGGNAFWVLSSPSWTWEFNATTGEWSQRESYGLLRWRGQSSARAFGRWVVGDTQSSKIHYVTASAYDEDGSPLIARAEGILKEFPARMRVPSVNFDFTTGQGSELGEDPIETDPRVAISWSHDGGATWSDPLWRDLGSQGKSKTQIRVNNLGRSTPHGTRVAWECSDPVWLQFRGASILNPVPRKP